MKFTTILFVALCPFALSAQVSITIKGKATADATKKQLYFYKQTQMRPIPFDSSAVNADGSFSKEFKISTPGIYMIGLEETDIFPFWADSENLEINLVKDMPAQITGGRNTGFVNAINKLKGEFAMQRSSRDPKVNQAKVAADYKEKLKSEVTANAELPAVIYALKMLDLEADVRFLKEAGAVLVKANPGNQAVRDFVFDLTRLNAGHPATEVEYLNMKGEQSSLIKKLGEAKYTLVDFWGTYCVPCREGIPGIKKLYAQYKSKGFDVLAISLDNKDDIWMKSIAEEQMPWAQGRVTDNGRKVMTDYRFNGIPYLALFDQQGNIVALSLQHEDLEKKMEELMGKPDLTTNTETKVALGIVKSAKEIALIKRVVNANSLTDYTTYFLKLNEVNYKNAYLKSMSSNIGIKDYQATKMDWNLGGHFKKIQQALQSERLSGQQKIDALKETDKNWINFLRGILHPDEYQKYLDLRLSKKLSL